jgi:tRNA 2-selenouridine synthase
MDGDSRTARDGVKWPLEWELQARAEQLPKFYVSSIRIMMQQPIELEKALQQKRKGALFVDVRTPAEFAEATIPGAVNVPLFSNTERAEIGTVYKQQGKKVARKLGIQKVAPRIPALIEQVEAACQLQDGPLIVFCWRGGMRSLAMASFLQLAGLPARQLIGGHKAFRRMVHDYFMRNQWPPIYVLRGLTGVGKTRVLNELAERGLPVIDLEGLANHRGSAFGALGLQPQPSQKMFEALLWDRLEQLQGSSYLATEGESRHVGRVLVPPRFHQAMQTQVSLWLEATLDTRVGIILDDYPARDQLRDQFLHPLQALKERLGKQTVAELTQLLEQGQWERLVRELMVRYYDPLYLHTKPDRRVELQVEPQADCPARVAEVLEEIHRLACP